MQVNNWDLVDTSCRIIIGVYLMNNPLHMNLLTRLALSDNIWLRRISIVRYLYYDGFNPKKGT